MRENSSTKHQRWGGPRERERCLREARRYLQPADAEDAVQEALLRAWRKADALVPPTGPLPWLLAITRNEALRVLARTRPEPVADLPESHDDDPDLSRTHLRVDVDRILGGFPESYRRLFDLYYRQDMSQADIAGLLGIPEGTVKQRLHGLRGLLRPTLETWQR